MGNWCTCCLKPIPSPKLDRGSRHVKSKCKSKVHEEAAEDTETVETVPATQKSKRLNSLALKGYHRKNISAPAMAQAFCLSCFPADLPQCFVQSTLILKYKFKQVRQKRKGSHLRNEFPGRLTKRSGSCPTVFLYDDTVSQPNFSTIIQAVSMAIYNNIKYRVGNKTTAIFDEKKHPFRHEVITKNHFRHDPELKSVYKFVCTLFRAEHLTAKCAIVTLIYLERVRQHVTIDVCPINWKRMLLGAATVAYELWDKQALWDVPYCQLINNIITVEDMNEIEMHFLSYIDYDTTVPASLYAKYYFDLRYLAHENNPLALVKNLCKERAQSTEAISRGSQKKDLGRAAIERSLSADNVIGIQHTKAILS
uniref:Cyclin N-terminal domain-containing protein n=1 Tax=Myotis lucifugus TaxID=59463 RepID=L7N1N0_MYOLU